MQHDFQESLAFSHSVSDLPIWRDIYTQAFPSLQAMVDHRQDGEHQRAGIDRSLVLGNSKQVLIDEKARGRNKITGFVYQDIALEYWSHEARRVPGWVCKPLRADFICYVIVPLGKAYLLPVPQLQQAWLANSTDWIGRYKRIDAKNNGYNTISVGVPVNVLFAAIGKALRLSFSPIEWLE